MYDVAKMCRLEVPHNDEHVASNSVQSRLACLIVILEEAAYALPPAESCRICSFL